jgi:2-phosphosulfolactate phosphatase
MHLGTVSDGRVNTSEPQDHGGLSCPLGDNTIIQRTSAGTRGIVEAASDAERLYPASLVTADATVRALLSGSPDQVSLVAMGDNGLKRTDEDELCAIHLRNRPEGRPGNRDAIRRLILAGGEVGRFHDPTRPYLHQEEVDIALDIDRYDFAVRVDFEDGRPVARAESQPDAEGSEFNSVTNSSEIEPAS